MGIRMAVSIMDMSIENMTMVSYLLFVMAGVCALAAVVMFFALDIPKCWRMVSGQRAGKKRDRAGRTGHIPVAPEAAVEKPSGRSEATLPLPRRAEPRTGISVEETLPLGDTGNRETEPLDTEALALIQDIVYVEEQGNKSIAE